MLQQLATRVLYSNNNPCNLQQNLDQYYVYMFDIIDSKLYRPTTSNKNHHLKAYELSIFKTKLLSASNSLKYLTNLIIAQLPRELQNKENRPVITYRLTNTIRSKILNYIYTVNPIYVEDEISFTLNTDPCECEHSLLIDPHHKRIITVDLRIVGNC